MRKRLSFVVALTALLLTVTSTPASASAPGALAGIWHRLNPQQSQANPAPEHELLQCEQRSSVAGPGWGCRYFKLPEPDLNFAWNTTKGRFVGTDVTATWTCPYWFPFRFCTDVVQVVDGAFTFDLATGGQISIPQDLIVMQSGGEQRLSVYWINRFVCPWFRSFDEALAANPFPLPFNGLDGPPNDCAVAP
jgi:hypothetical protein